MFADLGQFHRWFAERRQAHEYEVTKTSLDDLDGWLTDPRSGDIVHRSGKFFALRGVQVETNRRPHGWAQPIIVQPEIGLLGIVTTMMEGELYCLMQAKMEPGNINLLQLSPTVQATRSNYTQVHGGSRVPYLEHFTRPRPAVTLYDMLQSEHGPWFLEKRNRNVIVRLTTAMPAGEEFCWLSLSQIAELHNEPNLINMDARTVLSGMPFTHAGNGGRRHTSLHSDAEVLSWFTEVKTRSHLHRTMVPLARVTGWERKNGIIARDDGKHFSITGVHVRATSREVGEWWQPMLEPAGRGVIAFLGRHIDDVFHVLVHGRTEAGTRDLVEMAPTVSCIPENYGDVPAGQRPRFLDLVRNASRYRVLIDVVHSEEGGRLSNAENRYLVIDVGEEFDVGVPTDFCWMTPDQLARFVGFSSYVNVTARSLLSCMAGEPALSPPSRVLTGP